VKTRAIIVVGALAFLPLVAACSSSSTQSELASALQESASADGEELTDSQADCIAGVFIEYVGEDNVQQIIDNPDNTDAVMDEAMGSEDDISTSLEFLTKMSECAPELFGDMPTGDTEDLTDPGPETDSGS
jgi:hypothetical protein